MRTLPTTLPSTSSTLARPSSSSKDVSARTLTAESQAPSSHANHLRKETWEPGEPNTPVICFRCEYTPEPPTAIQRPPWNGSKPPATSVIGGGQTSLTDPIPSPLPRARAVTEVLERELSLGPDPKTSLKASGLDYHGLDHTFERQKHSSCTRLTRTAKRPASLTHQKK